MPQKTRVHALHADTLSLILAFYGSQVSQRTTPKHHNGSKPSPTVFLGFSPQKKKQKLKSNILISQKSM